MLSKSRAFYKIEAMAKGKPFDFDKALSYAAYSENEHEKTLDILKSLKKNRSPAYDFHLITEITTQVLVE